MLISDFSTHQLIFQDYRTSVYRTTAANQRVVAYKVLNVSLPSVFQLQQFFNEYEILKGKNIPGIRRVWSKTEINGKPAIELEYLEGLSLQDYMNQHRISFLEKLKFALRMAAILVRLQQHRIIHKDLNPKNLIVNLESHDISLIDFEFATCIDLKTHHLGNPERIEGTLAYISPEQTGRMNRIVDQRSDMYSLGVCLYQLFTGQLPFDQKDPMELVYGHLARVPTAPEEVQSEIPPVLSKIILKLLAKNAEDRYQSAYGLHQDLQNCLTLWETVGFITDFPLAQQDFSGKFQLPQKLYGRENELRILQESYQIVSGGSSMLILVAGYSGVGKSSLVYEVHKPITENRGIFIEGKFDQFHRDIPYYAWIQAFNHFVDQLLTENPLQLEHWKTRLLEALHGEGKILTDVVPKLEKILGRQAEVPLLAPHENLLRFNRIVQNFIHTLARAEHPLFIFIDDWQWTDVASLDLLKLMMEGEGCPHLLITGAYRDNEVDLHHPFIEVVRQLEREKITLRQLKLENLQPQHTAQLIADTLSKSVEDCHGLTEIIYSKTEGNAFFLRQMLQSLYEKKAITFIIDDERGNGWLWDLEHIRQMRIAANVLELMLQKVEQLGFATQRTMMRAACIGTLFKLELLALITERDAAEIRADLQPALMEGLIIPSGHYFTFAHDRIQQAVYLLISEEDRQKLHYSIGKLLWSALFTTPGGGTTDSELIFNVANQMMAGNKYLKDEKEQLEVAELFLRAGVQARASNAYTTAARYINNGIELMSQEDWQDHYALMFQLYEVGADCEMSIQNFDASEVLMDRALEHARSRLDKARLLKKKSDLYAWLNKFDLIFLNTRQALRQIGIEIPDTEEELRGDIQEEETAVFQLLEHLSIPTLIEAPPVKDKVVSFSLDILPQFAMSSLMAGQSLVFQFCVLKGIHLTLVHGQGRGTANIYSMFCSLLATNNRYAWSYQFAELSIAMVERDPSVYRPVHTITRATLWGLPYGRHLAATIPVFESGFRLVPNQVLRFMAANVMLDIFYHRRSMGVSLELMLDESKRVQDAAREANFLMFEDFGRMEEQIILFLMGQQVEDPVILPDSSLQSFNNPENIFTQAFLNQVRLQCLCWFPQIEVGQDFLQIVKSLLHFSASNINWADYDFYAVIFIAIRFPDILSKKREPHWTDIQQSRERLQLRAQACPDNFSHKHYLVEAISAQADKRFLDALQLYNQAISSAAKYKFTHIEALGHELFADFFNQNDYRHAATGHVRESIRLYHKWGALAKVLQLEKCYPHLKERSTNTSWASADVSSSSSSSELDYISLLKASQTLSEEIVLSNLLGKMLHIVMESAGAEMGVMIELKQDQMMLRVKSSNGRVELFNGEPIGMRRDLPLSIIHYVQRTGEPVVLYEARQDGQFGSDPYLQNLQPRSVLCFPVLRKGNLKAIFYFENNLMAGTFTEGRLQILQTLSSQIGISLENATLYEKIEQALAKQLRLTESYSRFVPREFIRHLGHDNILDVKLGDQVKGEMSVLFADIRSYTSLSELMTPHENFNFINAYLKRVGPSISGNGGFIAQYYGDGFMAIFMNEPQHAIQASLDIQKTIQHYNDMRTKKGRPAIKVGVGIHTGPLMMGIIGDEKRMDTSVISDTVNTASRLEGLTKHYHADIIISGATIKAYRDLFDPQSRFLGKVLVKGKKQTLGVYEIYNPQGDLTGRKKASTKKDFEKGLSHYFERDFLNATLRLKKVSDRFPEDYTTQQYLRRAAFYLVEGAPEDWTGVEVMETK